MSLFRYSYYDSPEGKDLFKKLFFTNKYVSIVGFGLAASEIILVSKPIGYLNTLHRFGQLMTPMIAATSAFCIVAHTSYKIRGKDDLINYTIGGYAAGSLFGVLIKQNLIGMWLGVVCAVIGATKKHSMLNGYQIFPAFPKHRQPVHGNFRTPYRNWSLYEKRPKGWIAAEERME